MPVHMHRVGDLVKVDWVMEMQFRQPDGLLVSVADWKLRFSVRVKDVADGASEPWVIEEMFFVFAGFRSGAFQRSGVEVLMGEAGMKELGLDWLWAQAVEEAATEPVVSTVDAAVRGAS